MHIVNVKKGNMMGKYRLEIIAAVCGLMLGPLLFFSIPFSFALSCKAEDGIDTEVVLQSVENVQTGDSLNSTESKRWPSTATFFLKLSEAQITSKDEASSICFDVKWLGENEQ